MQNNNKPPPPNACTCIANQRVIILEISYKTHKLPPHYRCTKINSTDVPDTWVIDSINVPLNSL